ncbi:phage holin family protein [Thioalkalivibrio sp. ALJ7]|uniref:phage holin family protein n=1 Tax=Thioalkalivibrio sp. ALJ7 TaxID=1158756 RepID=UPI000365511A|nr:phage holin family protein [Thioalkalivibrio sp. ALJ7]
MSSGEGREAPNPPNEDAAEPTADPQALADDVGRMLADSGRLFGIETRRLIRNTIGVLVLAVGLGVLLVSTWLVALAAGVFWLHAQFTLSMMQALLLTALGTLVSAAIAIWGLRQLLRGMTYPETRALMRDFLAAVGARGEA